MKQTSREGSSLSLRKNQTPCCFEGCMRLSFRPGGSARFCRSLCPGIDFIKKSSVYEKQNFSFSIKKRSGKQPVKDGDWGIDRSLPENLLYDRPVGSEVFLQRSANFNIAYYQGLLERSKPSLFAAFYEFVNKMSYVGCCFSDRFICRHIYACCLHQFQRRFGASVF